MWHWSLLKNKCLATCLINVSPCVVKLTEVKDMKIVKGILPVKPKRVCWGLLFLLRYYYYCCCCCCCYKGRTRGEWGSLSRFTNRWSRITEVKILFSPITKMSKYCNILFLMTHSYTRKKCLKKARSWMARSRLHLANGRRCAIPKSFSTDNSNHLEDLLLKIT